MRTAGSRISGVFQFFRRNFFLCCHFTTFMSRTKKKQHQSLARPFRLNNVTEQNPSDLTMRLTAFMEPFAPQPTLDRAYFEVRVSLRALRVHRLNASGIRRSAKWRATKRRFLLISCVFFWPSEQTERGLKVHPQKMVGFVAKLSRERVAEFSSGFCRQHRAVLDWRKNCGLARNFKNNWKSGRWLSHNCRAYPLAHSAFCASSGQSALH